MPSATGISNLIPNFFAATFTSGTTSHPRSQRIRRKLTYFITISVTLITALTLRNSTSRLFSFEIKGQDFWSWALMKGFCSSSVPGLVCQGDECSELREHVSQRGSEKMGVLPKPQPDLRKRSALQMERNWWERLLGEVPATLAVFPCSLWPTEDMQIGMQSHLFTGVNLLCQRFLLGWVLGITGSLMLNKGCPCRSRCRWRLYRALVFVCTPGAPPPAAACSHGNESPWTTQTRPRKVLELSLHSRTQGQPLAFLPMASSLILCWPVWVCQGHRGTFTLNAEWKHLEIKHHTSHIPYQAHL